MLTVRRAAERGHSNLGWLDSRHTFSFAGYHDAKQMGFRTLRVINDDRVEPGQGFGTHPHHDMEIVSIVLEGALEHKDSMGTGSIIQEGDVQRMTAGTGVTHSEFNHSRVDPVHFLQIWILPQRQGLKPGYEQKAFPEYERENTLRLVASDDGREGTITVHQDVALHVGHLDAGKDLRHVFGAGRHGWIQMTAGRLKVNNTEIETGDGLAVSDVKELTLHALESRDGAARFLLFDLA